MSPFQAIVYFGILVWFLPPFRQVRSPYFYFFYVLALMDPVAILLKHILPLSVNVEFVLGPCFIIISLITMSSNKKVFFINSILVSTTAILLKIFLPDYTNFISVILMLVIFLLILKRTTQYIAYHTTFNLFHIALLIYMGSNVIKFIIFSADIFGGLPFFFLTNLFQIFFGIFFVIFREDSKILHIKINTTESMNGQP